MKRIGLALALLILSAGMAGADQPTPEDQIRAWLIDEYDLDMEHHEIEVLPGRLSREEDIQDVEVVKALTQTEPLGLFSLLVNLYDSEGEVQSAQVRTRIKRFADVLVAVQRIPHHTAATSELFELQRQDVTTLRERPIVQFEEIDGMRMKRSLRRGAILTARSLEPVPDVEMGTDVTIVYSSGTCTITALGKTLETGYVGDLVRVKNASSGKIIKATVTDGATVSLTPSPHRN